MLREKLGLGVEAWRKASSTCFIANSPFLVKVRKAFGFRHPMQSLPHCGEITVERWGENEKRCAFNQMWMRSFACRMSVMSRWLRASEPNSLHMCNFLIHGTYP